MPQVVAIVDDDEAARESTAALLRSADFDVELFESGDAFLNGAPTRLDCILLDMRMPGSDGIAVLRQLGDGDPHPPVLVVTGHGDVTLAVQAMKLGAIDFLEKPYDPAVLLDALGYALSYRQPRHENWAPSKEAVALIGQLTPRQRDVLRGLLGGHPNKIIAWKLGLSIRTVEAYRAQLMSRLQVRSIAEAVKMALSAGLTDPQAGPTSH